MDYTITKATPNNVPDIVEITMVSFADALQKLCHLKLGAGYSEHKWLAWDNYHKLIR